MSTLKIKDLTDSIDLDRKAMLAIVGGARRTGAVLPYNAQAQQGTRLVNFAGGPGSFQLTGTGLRRGRI